MVNIREGIDLIVRDEIREVVVELLAARRVTVNPLSTVAVVERGLPLPEEKICVVFEWSRIQRLFELLLDSETVTAVESGPRSIIGRAENDTLEILPFERICFFEARGNNTICVTPEGEYRVKEKLYELETALPTDRFIRVSRSFIVNIQNVRQIVPWFGRRLVLKFNHTKAEVEVSKNYASSFKDFLGL